MTRTREATAVRIEFLNRILVMFPDKYELRFVAQIEKPFRRRAIHNVQLFHENALIAEYDGLVEYTSRRDPIAKTLSPRKMVLGSAADLIPFWEGALRFIDRQYREYRSQFGRKKKVLTDQEERYIQDILIAMQVASSSEHDLKRLKRQTGREG